MSSFTVSGNIVNVVDRKTFSGTIVVRDGIIASVTPSDEISYCQALLMLMSMSKAPCLSLQNLQG